MLYSPRGTAALVSTNPAQPAGAASYGFNNLIFQSEFDSINEIDVNNTLQPGYKWYVQSLVVGTYPTNTKLIFPSSCFSISNSVLTFNPSNPLGGTPDGGSIYSAGFKNDNTFIGNTIPKGGFYAECRMSYDPTLSTIGRSWFPAFWMWDKSIVLNSATNTPYSGNRYSEFDVFEAATGSGTTTPNYVCWDWTGPGSFVRNTNYVLGVPTVDSNFHTYAVLWVPQVKNSGSGLVRRYIDGVAIGGSDVNYSSSTISAQANTGATTGWMSGADVSTQGFTLNLQSGLNWPINIDWVRVWQ